MQLPIKKITLMALFLSLTLIINRFDALIPLINIAPGIRLGLSNIIIIFVLYIYSFKEAFLLMILKNFISSFLFNGMTSLFYSLNGGILSIISMYLSKKIFKENISEIGISVLGSFFHNTGQILTLILFTKSLKIGIYYYPIIIYIGIITGFFIGIFVKKIIKKYKKIFK